MGLHEDMRALVSAEERDKTGRGLSPSDVGALFPGGCKRQLAYREQGYPAADPMPDHYRRAALLGEAVHEVAARARKNAGWERVETFVEVPGLDRRGKLDAYHQGHLDDVKSKSKDGLRAVRDRGSAYEADQGQVNIYGAALAAEGLPVKRCSVTYVSRDDGDVWEDSWTWDAGEAKLLLMELSALTDLVRHLPPEKIPRGGKRHNARPCDACPFRTECWDLTAELPEGQNPTSAKLAPAEVASAAADLERLRREKAEIEAAEAWCRTALAGHSSKVFVDSEGIKRRIHWTRSKPEGGQLDQRRAADMLAELGLTPPRLGTVSQCRLPAVD